jgi:hypothetical protein
LGDRKIAGWLSILCQLITRSRYGAGIGCVRGAKPLFLIFIPLPWEGRGIKGVGQIPIILNNKVTPITFKKAINL